MTFMPWTVDLEVGHPEIDAQHRTLVDAINNLHAAMKQGKGREELGKTLRFLQEYTVSHFTQEEAMMARSKYPRATFHMRIHADLLTRVAELVEQYQAGGMVITHTVMDFLQDWLEKHIQGEDVLFVTYMKKQGDHT